MRDKAAAEKKNFTYPRPKDFPSAIDAQNARSQGRPVTIRFAMGRDKPIVVEDIVRGRVKFGPGEMGDFIIQKNDGFPTYHLACVIDDELMGVTHIIRGQEHLMNTPGHQALQEALGFRTPAYAHMSVTISETGGKLSKRQRPQALQKAIKAIQDADLEAIAKAGKISAEELNAFLAGKKTPDTPNINLMAEHLGVTLPEINVVDFLNSGYLPEAMVNFLALLGWSPGDDREIMALDELINAFDIKRLTKSNSFFDRKKLLSFNTEHIRMVPEEKLMAHFKNYLKAVDSAAAAADDQLIKRILKASAGARTLAEIEKKVGFLFIENDGIEYDPKAVKKVLLKHDGLAILAILKDRLAALEELTAETIEKVIRDLAEERQVGLGKIAQPLRVAICGATISPPIFDSVDMLGMENTLVRINIALDKFKQVED